MQRGTAAAVIDVDSSASVGGAGAGIDRPAVGLGAIDDGPAIDGIAISCTSGSSLEGAIACAIHEDGLRPE